MKAMNSIFDVAGKTPLLTAEEEVALSKRIESGDSAARDKMIQANLRLALSVVKKYSKRGVDLEDLFQESVIGLARAVDRFDWRKGFKFSTYAYWWIQQSVRQYLASNSGPINLPSDTFSKLYKISEFEKEYQKEFGKKPTDVEIAEMFGTTTATLRSLKQSSARTLSLDAPAYRSEDSGSRSTLADIIPSGESSVEEKIDNQRLQSRINEVLSTLTEREKTIIKMRFGIKDQEDK